jgi:hypothetical protein
VCGGLDSLAHIACANIVGDPLVHAWPVERRTQKAVGLLATEMTSRWSVVNFVHKPMLEILIVRNHITRFLIGLDPITQ